MKAALLTSFQREFQILDIDPKLEMDDVLLNVKATGICGRDLVIWKGGFANLKPPLILGHEIFGELDGLPKAVYPALNCGNCEYCRSNMENLCTSLSFLGENRFGGYAEQVAISRDSLLDLPDRDYEKYAATMCPIATAIHACKLVDVEDKKVLVTGAGGGVGIHAIQYLKLKGAKVIAITSEHKLKFVEKYADQAITEKAFSKIVKNVDVVFEIVGSATINESLRALKRQGTLVLIGNLEGNEISLQRPPLFIMREHRIIGSAAYTKQDFKEALSIVSRYIDPYYTPYRLDQINDAYRDLLSN